MVQPKNVYILFFKPYGVVTQFSRVAGHRTLSDFGPFPVGVYPVGRLDADSEGLLLLTNDNRMKHRLTDPRFGHPRTYLVQVEGIPSMESQERLRHGVVIDGRMTRPAHVRFVEPEPALPPRPVPIRFRKTVPTSWIEITLYEGRNRQVRRMTASIGSPTLRLIRTAIDCLTIGRLAPGEWRRLHPSEVEQLMKSLARHERQAHSRPPGSIPGMPGRRRNNRSGWGRR